MPARARGDLEQGRRRLEDTRVNLVVLGEFKRGKSTLVNALLGQDVVPTGVLPLTAAVIALRHGPAPRLLIDLEDGVCREASPAELAEFATEAGNPGNRRGVRQVTVELPAPLLAEGVQLVDTPGIGSVFAHNTETALSFRDQIDAGLFVLAADQPLSEVEEGLVGEAAERLPRIFFALNRIDRLEPAELDEVVGFVRDRLRQVLGSEPELFPLSARRGDGLEPLRARLAELASSEREAVLERSVAALAGRFAADALHAVRFERHAVELPLVELEQRLEEFRQRAAALAETQEEAAQLLLGAARRLIAETVNEPLLSLARREGPSLAAELEAFASERGKIGPRLLAPRLEEWIDAAIRDRFERLGRDYEQRLAEELAALHGRYAERVERVMADLDAAAGEVFGAPVGQLLPEVELRLPSRFSFKLHDVEREMLDQLASAASAAAPGPLGRRLVLRESRQRLALLLDRHAGRLRSDLAARVDESVHEYARELELAVREAIASVEAAVDRARREQRSGRARVEARLGELRTVERRVSGVQAALLARAGGKG